ncbi:hypothetical protein GCM10023340_32340 [Nocardioides marinquilinus]|uniref:DNA-directed RNA polymerase specialized sigma24 family protein n=1 Tax=Nocardioides marinquilinus TaxID=1210400 RepID=A0ABP9PU77_9ACTN
MDRLDPGGHDARERQSYLVGRWTACVRTLVLLGVPPAAAVRLTVETFADRLAPRDDDGLVDPDVDLFAGLLARLDDDHQAWWAEPVDPPPSLAALEPTLDRLDPARRRRLVLRAVARLDDVEVAQVLGEELGWATARAASRGADLPGRDVGDLGLRVAQAADEVDPGPPDLAAAVELAGERTRRGRRRRGLTAAAVVVVLLVLAPVVVESARRGVGDSGVPGPDETGTASPTADAAPATEPAREALGGGQSGLAPTAWWSGGAVTVGERRVPLGDVVSLAAVDGGVVAVTAAGDVVEVVGRRPPRTVGATSGGGGVTSSPDSGLAAWLAPGGRLVVRSTLGGRDVLTRQVGATTRVVALDDARVYLDDPPRVLVVGAPDTTLESPGPGLLDVAGGVSLRQLSTLLRLDRPETQSSVGLGAEGGSLSRDGRYALTRPLGSSGPYADVVDSDTGEQVPLPLPGSSVVVDAAFGEPDSVTFALARANGEVYPPDRPRDAGYQPGYDLVVCRLSTRGCSISTRLFDVSTPPLLAR